MSTTEQTAIKDHEKRIRDLELALKIQKDVNRSVTECLFAVTRTIESGHGLHPTALWEALEVHQYAGMQIEQEEEERREREAATPQTL